METRSLHQIQSALEKMYAAVRLLERNSEVDPETVAAVRAAIGLLEEDEYHLEISLSSRYQD